MVTDGKLDTELFNVERRVITSEVYPCQEKPSIKAINDWKKAVRSSYIHGDMRIGRILVEQTIGDESVPRNLQLYIASQPSHIKQIMGVQSEEWTEDTISAVVAALKEGKTITIFGDGSVKDGRGSHAYRIIPHDNLYDEEGTLTAGAKTNGDRRWITSLHTEQMSQLGALYTILAIAVTNDVTDSKSTFLFRYNNQESLRRVKLVHSFYTEASPFATDYDVWAEITRVCERFPNVTIEESWVKGHQDDDTEGVSIEAQHNIDMDALAEVHRESEEIMPQVPLFCSERAQILMDVTQGFHHQLRVHLLGGNLRRYIYQGKDWLGRQ